MARPLAVFSQALQGLVDKGYILLVDVQSEETKASSCAPADTVQKLQCLTHQIVVGLIILATKEILQRGHVRTKAKRRGQRSPILHL